MGVSGQVFSLLLLASQGMSATVTVFDFGVVFGFALSEAAGLEATTVSLAALVLALPRRLAAGFDATVSTFPAFGDDSAGVLATAVFFDVVARFAAVFAAPVAGVAFLVSTLAVSALGADCVEGFATVAFFAVVAVFVTVLAVSAIGADFFAFSDTAVGLFVASAFGCADFFATFVFGSGAGLATALIVFSAVPDLAAATLGDFATLRATGFDFTAGLVDAAFATGAAGVLDWCVKRNGDIIAFCEAYV